MAIKKTDASMNDINDDSENLPATTGTGAVARANTEGLTLGAVDGDTSSEDFRLPRLKIAHGVGGLAENFNPGALVLADENLLANRGEPINVIVLNATTYWKEYKYTPGQPPRTFNSEAEVLTAGESTRWVDGQGPTFNKAMCLKILIQKPKELICSLFGVPVGEHEYAPAVWDVDKSAYKRVAPVINTAASFSLRNRGGLLAGMFEIKTRAEQVNGNTTNVPIFKLISHNTDEEIDQIKTLFEQNVTEEVPF